MSFYGSNIMISINIIIIEVINTHLIIKGVFMAYKIISHDTYGCMRLYHHHRTIVGQI